MSNNIGKINTELLTKSSETISGVTNLIYNTSFVDQFIEMEEYFRLINFEHSNCLIYKDSLEYIYSSLKDVKDKLFKLSEALKNTENNFKEIESLTENDAKKISNIYESTPASSKIKELLNAGSDFKKNLTTSIDNIENDDITKIPPVEQNTSSIEEKPYNTLPIGLAIGATGIAGSVGAVVVNEKYGTDSLESKIDEYYDLDDDEPDFTVSETPEKKEEEILPYHASRTERESDKYYGNEKDDLNLDEYEEDDSDNPDDY